MDLSVYLNALFKMLVLAFTEKGGNDILSKKWFWDIQEWNAGRSKVRASWVILCEIAFHFTQSPS